ncbi:unnamed protein product [Symbiodinium necroappetens]|uniref:Peptidase C14 caspase domain-containing protein n=1 Tax=Symbiodinium necroappetens TaxID=1628268 RepID=A0A812SNT3_9DINO|nr:unnamed protein product [Symbiodinium necroappetens]
MAERRLAVLIGQSSSVPGFQDLKYCRQDVDKLHWALEKLCGFRVLRLTDAEKADFRALRKQFMQELSGEKGALALVYYAGHGVCSQGIAYWIPIDAEKDQLSTYQAVNDFLQPLCSMTSQCSSANKAAQSASASPAPGTRLVVIQDCCREIVSSKPADDSFPQHLQQLFCDSRIDSQVCLVYACSEGRYAGESVSQPQGQYTAAFIGALETPGLDWYKLLEESRKLCLRDSKKFQQPWFNFSGSFSDLILHPESSLSDGYFFAHTLAIETDATGIGSAEALLRGLAIHLRGLTSGGAQIPSTSRAASISEKALSIGRELIQQASGHASRNLLSTCYLLKIIGRMLPDGIPVLQTAAELRVRSFLHDCLQRYTDSPLSSWAAGVICEAHEAMDATVAAKEQIIPESASELSLFELVKLPALSILRKASDDIGNDFQDAGAQLNEACNLRKVVTSAMERVTVQWHEEVRGSLERAEAAITDHVQSVVDSITSPHEDQATARDFVSGLAGSGLEGSAAERLVDSWLENVNMNSPQFFRSDSQGSLCFEQHAHFERFVASFREWLRVCAWSHLLRHAVSISELGATRMRDIFNPGKPCWSSVVSHCESGHLLEMSHSLCSCACNLCGRSQDLGSRVYQCKQCNYTVCDARSCGQSDDTDSTGTLIPWFQAGVPEKAFEQGESRDERFFCKIFGRSWLGAAAAAGALVPPVGLALGTFSTLMLGGVAAAAGATKGRRGAQDFLHTFGSAVVGLRSARLSVEDLMVLKEEQLQLVQNEWHRKQEEDLQNMSLWAAEELEVQENAARNIFEETEMKRDTVNSLVRDLESLQFQHM